MKHFLYTLGVRLYGFAIGVATLWSLKAKKWKKGRRNWKAMLKKNAHKVQGAVWFHAASSGEFEQAKPLIEWLKQHFPHQNILVTFFSPSGYEQHQHYAPADYITYLPLDTPQNAKTFLQLVKPKIAIFIKYEFWLNFLFQMQALNVPCMLISGVFRKDSPFFRGFLRDLYQTALQAYHHIFVQNAESLEYLTPYIEKDRVSLAGDTRIDRVIQIYENWKPVSEIEGLLPRSPVLMAGSSWYPDEQWLQKLLAYLPQWNLVIVPHEISDFHSRRLKKLFPDALFYSEWLQSPERQVTRVLVIDKVGWLSRLYRYADAVWIGGGFGKGIHNVLEAAVYGKPILFGPNHQKFPEAVALVQCQAALPVYPNTSPQALATFLNNPNSLKKAATSAQQYVFHHQGATLKIIKHLVPYLTR